MIRYLLVFLFLLIGVVKLPAQSIHHPWILSFGNSYTDFHLPVKSDLSAIFTSADWMGAHVPMSIRAGIRLSNSFTFSAVSSATKLEPEKLNTIPLQDPVNNELFWKAGGQLEYKLANGYLLRTTSKVDPYLLIGANGTRINEEIHFSQSVGVGINLWLSRQVGINFQGTYDRINDFNDYTHFIVGIVTRVGNMADRDRDGVPNKLDKCPTVAGVKHLDGCPDYDMDGITDSLDRCPRVYGPIESDGCPDFDLDGVPDHEDKCPCDPGPYRYSGCPDSDGDGIIDKDDLCPEEKGPRSNNGCPEAISPAKEDGEMPQMLPVTEEGETIRQQEEINTGNAFPDLITRQPKAYEDLPEHYKYHIIIGSFEDLGNALKRKTELELKGYHPRILGQDRNRFHRLSIGSYDDPQTARRELNYIRQRITDDAWILTE